MKKITNWIVDHDNKKLFIVFYIGLSLVLSIAISLFWLLFAVIIHFIFEITGQSQKKESKSIVFFEALWETKLDFALVAFALWLAVYLDFIFGVAGIGAVARAGTQTASRIGSKAAEASVRFASWTRVIRAILLSVDDAEIAAKSFFQYRKAKNGLIQQEPEACYEEPNCNISSWHLRWKKIDYFGPGLLVVCILLVIVAPLLIGLNYQNIFEIIKNEFNPFPK